MGNIDILSFEDRVLRLADVVPNRHPLLVKELILEVSHFEWISIGTQLIMCGHFRGLGV